MSQTHVEPALFRRRPWLSGQVAHRSLGVFPTAVERALGLLSPRVELWIKREDRAGTLYGGNKVRKLEFLLAEAIAAGKDRVATIGGWGSNHALATAIYAASLGLRCDLHLFPQPMSDRVRQSLRADLGAGAHVHVARHIAGLGPSVLQAQLSSNTRWIAGGGSSPLGSLGWVSAADEIIEQVERGELPRPHAIYVALGSCGTVAGLLAGLRGSTAAPDEVVAVRVVERLISNGTRTRNLEHRTLALTQPRAPSVAVPLRVEHGQIGAGYGHVTDRALRAVEAAAAVGLHLETTYTGKCMAQLLADSASGRLDGKRVLFIDSYSSVDLGSRLAGDAQLPASVRRIIRPAGTPAP